jgi:hypothetical protein
LHNLSARRNFYLIGEATGERAYAVNILNTTGIDTAIGIDVSKKERTACRLYILK